MAVLYLSLLICLVQAPITRLGFIGLIPSTFGPISSYENYLNTHATKSACQSISTAVDVLVQHCPSAFRKAVRDSGHAFLYRGESVDFSSKCNMILSPEPDLLESGTYGLDENNYETGVDPAVEFFRCLEKDLSKAENLFDIFDVVSAGEPRLLPLPSVSHIGTADMAVAGQWGAPVSVWPLAGNDELFGYLWPRNRNIIYPGNPCPAQPEKNSFVPGRSEDFCVNRDLTDALRLGKEVMFTTKYEVSKERRPPSSFLAFPVHLDSQLISQLRKINYGL